MAMKTIFYLSALYLSLFIIYPIRAQVVVTGHVSAEIVDVVNVVSHKVFLSETTSSPEFITVTDSDIIVFGEVAVLTEENLAFNVALSSAILVGENGDAVVLETSYTPVEDTSINANKTALRNADQVLQLSGNVNVLLGQNPGNYQGSCHLILSYN